MHFISHFVIITALAVASLFGYHAQPQSFGSTFTPVGGSTYSLAGAGITNSATTLQLNSFTTPDGRLMTMAMFGSIGYGVIDPNTPSKIEDITFTGVTQNANGTATLTGVSRGMDFVTPYTASSTLAKSHSGGAFFILSNSAGFYGQQFLFSNSPASSTAQISFSPSAPPMYFPGVGSQNVGTYNSTTSEFASITYVNQVALSGAPNASVGAKGIVQISTARQAASSTSSGSTGALLVIPTSFATDTPQNCSTPANGGCSVMSLLNGKLSQSWLDLTQNFTFSGIVTNSATTSIAASGLLSAPLKLNTVSLAFPSSLPTGSSTPQIDSTGKVTYDAQYDTMLYQNTWVNTNTSANSTTTLALVTIPANTLGTTNKSLRIMGMWSSQNSGGGTACFPDIEYGNGNSTSTIGYVGDNSAGSIFEIDGTIYATSTSAQSSLTKAFAAPLNNSVRTAIYTGKYTAFSTAAPTYIAFSANNVGSDTCFFTGGTVELLTL